MEQQICGDGQRSITTTTITTPITTTPITTTTTTTITTTPITTTATSNDPTVVNSKMDAANIQPYLDLLSHSVLCDDDACAYAKCTAFKRCLRHLKTCPGGVARKCLFCTQTIALCVQHAKVCSVSLTSTCAVPHCCALQVRLQQAQMTGQLDKLKQFLASSADLLLLLPQRRLSQRQADDDANRRQLLAKIAEAKQMSAAAATAAATAAVMSASAAEQRQRVDHPLIKSQSARTELVKHMYSLCVDQIPPSTTTTPATATKAATTARFALYLIRSERHINAVARNLSDYLCLLVDLLHTAQLEFAQRLEKAATTTAAESCCGERFKKKLDNDDETSSSNNSAMSPMSPKRIKPNCS